MQCDVKTEWDRLVATCLIACALKCCGNGDRGGMDLVRDSPSHRVPRMEWITLNGLARRSREMESTKRITPNRSQRVAG